jgi:hypothetical protein
MSASKSGLLFSLMYDALSDISGSFSTDDVVLIWQYFAVGQDLLAQASGGLTIGIYSSLTAGDRYEVGGSDKPPFPYAAWWNVAIDPTLTGDNQDGGGNGGAWRYFGSIVGITVKITKGFPHAVDAIRYGRGEIYCTGTGCTFTGMAAANDDNSDPFNRWGLLQDTGGGTFLWKGLMSLGQSGTSATFSDSNKSIVIDDAAHTYLDFNKIAIRNASTSVTWTNISFTALGTVSPGQFEMTENATVVKTGCLFNNMDAFTYDSNATITGCTYITCNQITHGGADFEACAFEGYEGSTGTAYMLYAESTDPNGELDNCSFTKGTAATHAIEFDATNTPTTITLTGIDFSGYHADNGNNDSTLYFPSTSKSYTVNLSGCTGNISYRVGSGGSVTFVSDPVTLEFHVTDGDDGADLSGARVFAEVTDDANFPYQDTVTITGSGTTATVTHTGHGLATNDYVVIRGADQDYYNGVYQITLDGGDPTNKYTYTATETLSVSPATGTIKSTYVLISGTTDGSGEISDSWEISSDQPFAYNIRKGTSAPYFIGVSKTGTLTTTADLTVNEQLTRDQ